MKPTIKYSTLPVIFATSLVFLGACSSFPGNKSNSEGKDLANRGPTVIEVSTNPSTFDVNQGLDPVTRSQVIANVKDFNKEITSVTLRFLHVPMELSMRQVSPSTWVADLEPEQLKSLAVNGHTMKYEANVIAKDSEGLIGTSKGPVEISVKAPDINSTG